MTMGKRAGVSVLVPNWNHRFCLARALRSAVAGLRQLRAAGVSGELLVVDDASRDGSQKYLLNLAAHYPDLAVRGVWLGSNGGLGAARNVGENESRIVIVHFNENGETCVRPRYESSSQKST